MKRFLLVSVLLLSLFGASMAFAQTAQTPDEICAAAPTDEPETRTYSAADQVLETGIDYRAIFCTEAGAIYIDLLEDYSPITVNNFVFLAQNGYYNNTTFHRVLPNFMAQGGDPQGTGMGGPGYQFQNEALPFLTFDQPGVLAMANAGPNTNGSQFFITTASASFLGFDYSIFGVVLAGQENVNNIRLRDPEQNPTEPGASLDTVVIVTDPSTVNAEVTPTTTATREEAEAVYNSVVADITQPEVAEILGLDNTQSGMFEADAVVAAAPESVRDALSAYLETHSFEYRTGVSVVNNSCVVDAPPYYLQMTYTLDAFATPADATAALADATLAEVTAARGFSQPTTVQTLRYPVYTQPTSLCDIDAIHAVTHWQRGRYVVTAEVIYPANTNVPADLWLSRLVPSVMENVFADVLVKEVR